MLGAELMERTPAGQTPAEFFNDPGMKKIWDRLALTVSPDGAVIPYGASCGWDATGGERIWTTGTGGPVHGRRPLPLRGPPADELPALPGGTPADRSTSWTGPYSTEQIALAYLLADDRIHPVEPDAGSCVLTHKETLRVKGKQGAAQYLKDLDPAPDKAHICCGSDRHGPGTALQARLPQRVGSRAICSWVADLFARHEPMNAAGILGLTRFGTPFTPDPDEQGHHRFSQHAHGRGPRRQAAGVVTNANPHTIDAYYQRVAVEAFTGSPAGDVRNDPG